MKRQLIISIGLILTLIGCALFNPDLRFMPKSANEFYFPSLSEEFIERQNECIEKEKFPCDFPKPNDSLNDFFNHWYSMHLRSRREPIIYKKKRSGNKKIVRFTHLGTWSNPFSCRIENSSGEITLSYNRTNGLGGFSAGRRTKHKQKILKYETWEKILEKIDSIDFWNIDTHDPNMILDGEEWILEVLLKDQYHFVTRNMPDVYDAKEYAELCRLVMNAIDE